MILHLSIFGLLLILIATIVLSVREGFTNGTPTVTVSKICKSGDAFINLYGRTSSAASLSVRIVYSSTNNTITGTTVSDSVLTETATVSPAPTSATQEDSLITTVNANRLTDGKTYYMIARTNTSYTAGGTTPLLGSFVYRSADLKECASAIKPAPSNRRRTQDQPSNTDTSVTMSSDSYAALTAQQRSDLLRDVKRLMREEILNARQLRKPSDEMASYDDDSTDAMEQGREFLRRRRCDKKEDEESSCKDDEEEGETRCPTYPNGTCPPVPDMSKYIRKDAIPCWGCAIDF
jgi:hypothetical protein